MYLESYICDPSVWLLSLGTMFIHFLFAFSWLIAQFIFLALNSTPLYECATVYPFPYWWMFWLPSIWAVLKKVVFISLYMFCVGVSFQFFWVNKGSTITGFSGKSIFSFVRNCQRIFQSTHSILNVYQQWKSVPVSPCYLQHFMMSVLNLAILIKVCSGISIVLIYISLKLMIRKLFLCAYLPSAYLFWCGVYLELWPTFY